MKVCARRIRNKTPEWVVGRVSVGELKIFGSNIMHMLNLKMIGVLRGGG